MSWEGREKTAVLKEDDYRTLADSVVLQCRCHWGHTDQREHFRCAVGDKDMSILRT